MSKERHTYDMGIIGNCSFLAYVDKSGSINWLCWPRFDSPPIFGELLDSEKGGRFGITLRGKGQTTSHQYYHINSNVLITEIANDRDAIRITDYAPRFLNFGRTFKPLNLFRKIEKINGNPLIEVDCRPISDYGDRQTSTQFGSNHIRFNGLSDELRLTTDIPLTYIFENKAFNIPRAKYFCLTWGPPLEAPLNVTAEDFLHKTIDYWQTWVAHSSIPNVYQADVIRSALTLKLHQYEDTGAIIAAGTTSLPESPGSGRTWDYRYCWMRDSFYTLKAHYHIGQFEELERYAFFIENIVSNHQTKRLQPVYKINGDSNLEEKEIDWQGYQGNKPVRIGNEAYTQIQNDVYGQAIVAMLPLFVDQRFVPDAKLPLDLIHRLVTELETYFEEPDAGLWEFRHDTGYHCYTFLFHWAGAHAVMRIAKKTEDIALLERAKKLLLASENKIEECYDAERGVYTAAIGRKELDASTLNLITMGYLDTKPEIAKKHLEVLEAHLKAGEGLFYRYKHDDGFGEPEVAFGVCGLWYIQALAKVGRMKEAHANFKAFLRSGNHLGLFSEDVAPNDLSQWGNFPQTFTHIGIINAAHTLDRLDMRPAFLSED